MYFEIEFGEEQLAQVEQANIHVSARAADSLSEVWKGGNIMEDSPLDNFFDEFW